MNAVARLICFIALLAAFSFRAAAEDFTPAIQAFLQHRGEVEKTDGAIVVGILDEHGSSVIGYGKLDNGTDGEVNGDTVFNIYSSSCTFTALLLQNMVERGEMNLDDPVAKYLPTLVKVPTHNGKPITLRHLVTETSGFPYLTETFEYVDLKRAGDPFTNLTVNDLYAFVSDYRLTRDPGLVHVHGSVDMGLLGQAMVLKAGTNYEALLSRRICGPLKMDSTRGTLMPEMKSRFAFAHPTRYGYAVPPEDAAIMTPLSGLNSTVNDLLKYVSANLGFTPSRLPLLMEQLLVSFPLKLKQERETGIVESGGGNQFVGPSIIFDKRRNRGVVVLSASGCGLYRARTISHYLLESEWQSDRRPTATNLSRQVYRSCVGQYQRAPDYALGLFSIRQCFRNAPNAAVYIPAGFGLAMLWVLLRCARISRWRWILLGSMLAASGALAVLTPLVWSRVFCARYQSRIGVRSEGDRLFVQATAINLWPVDDWDHAPPGAQPIDVLLPPLPLELLSESETRFFERLSGMPVTFSRDGQGKVTGLIVQDHGKLFAYEKISDASPQVPEPPKRSVAIRLDTRLLDACVGHYEQAPCAAFSAGAKVTIWREGDQLFWRCSGRNAPKGAGGIYPESETNFFNKWGAVMTFVKNDKGEVTAVTFHDDNWPDIKATKLKNE
jgi:D-alanyl-D-alanine-carboxypeptidase/D-alanyl-D-alanine-endopeptidase